MKRMLIGLLLLIGTAAAQDNEEFRATWVVDTQWLLQDNSVAENKALTRQILDNHKAANMTSVIWQVRRFGTVYYPSATEPWGPQVNFADPGYDPLAYAIQEAHARGLELHAWFNTFESRHQYAGSPSQRHPEWICRDRDGNIMPSDIAWLSPGLQAVREDLRSVAMEIVRNYDIDGLHLDFIRWNEHTNSGNAPVLEKQKLSRMLPDGIITEAQLKDLQLNASGRYLYDVEHPFSAGVPAGFGSWEDWWRDSVTEFVRTLHDSIQAVKPWVRLSPAALGRYNWGGWNGFDVVFQDAALWLNQGYIEQLVGMHYHWDTPSELRSVLVSGCPNCWNQFILPAIQAGKMYTVGLFSDSFSERNIFGRHEPIVAEVRNVFWVDGFQFFSYASWRDRRYWDDAAASMFRSKTRIRAVPSGNGAAVAPPSIALTKLDSMTYRLDVTPDAGSSGNHWFALYRSQDAVLDVATDEILDIHFTDSTFAVTDSIPGTQDFDEVYTYFATALNRFWHESTPSNAVQSDSIHSFAPTVVASTPAQGDTVQVNSDIVLTFSKTMNTASADGAITLQPSLGISSLSWSADSRTVTIQFAGNFAYATDYTLTVAPQLTDVNGKAVDGNGDGMPGDAYLLHFTSLAEDNVAPQIVSSFPDYQSVVQDFRIDEVVTFQFDELLDPATVSSGSIQFQQAGVEVPFQFHLGTVNAQSVLSIQALDFLATDQAYTVTLGTTIADTAGNTLAQPVVANFHTSNVRYSESVLIDRFLSVVNWFQPNQSGSTAGIIVPNTSFAMSTAAYLPRSSLRQRVSPALTYEWDPTAPDFLIRVFLSTGPPRAVEFDTTFTLQCHVYGDGSGNEFRFAIDDKLPETAAANHEVSRWVKVDWVGWRLVEWPLSDLNETGTWIGDGVPDGQLRFDSFQLTRNSGAAISGRIFFDNLQLVKKTTSPVSVDVKVTEIPDDYRLLQNYPNPFNPSTTIAFELPVAGLVTLKIYDVRGREVMTLLDARYRAGRHHVQFDAGDLSSGVYIYRLKTKDKTLSRRMLFLK